MGLSDKQCYVYIQSNSGKGLFAYSSSETTPESLTVTIGKDEWTDVEAGSKNHIDGDFAPMYGKKTLAINEQPEITMNHLAAVVAIKFVNMSAGEIKVKRAEFGIPEITSGKDKQDGIKIAGDFTVNFTGNTLSFIPTDNSSTKVIAKLSQYKPVSNEGEITIYMPVRPFKAVEGTCVEVSINGSSKMVKLTEDINFEAGKVTTLRVTIPTLKGTLSSAITKNGTTFVE